MIVGLPAEDFVVLDVETTGFEPSKGDEIIEVAAQKMKGREVVGEFVHLVKPGRTVPADSTAVTGITNEMLADAKPAAEIIPMLVEFIGQSIIIGHNVGFDMGFVNAHLAKLGLEPLKNPTIDTCEIARRYLILSTYKLGNVATYLKCPPSSAHRALVDVETTREVFFKLIERAKQKV